MAQPAPSPRFNGTIALDCAITTPPVDFEAVLEAWGSLQASSVECALEPRTHGVLDFTETKAIFLAAVQAGFDTRVPWKDSEQYTTSLNTSRAILVSHTLSPGAPEEPIEPEHSEAIPDHPTSQSKKRALPEYVTDKSLVTVGVVYLASSHIPNQVQIGISILPQHRKHGIGMEACRLAVEWVIGEGQCHRVQALVMESPARERALRLFTALGFAHEGRQRRVVQNAQGEWADVTALATLDTEWLVRRHLRAPPRSMWDELFVRHQREREELLRWEERGGGPRRTSSMETLRVADVDLALTDAEDDDAQSSGRSASSASPSLSVSSLPSSRSSSRALEFSDVEVEDAGTFDPGASSRNPLLTALSPYLSDDEGSEASDPEWVRSHMRGASWDMETSEALSRPQSAASWSSFDIVESVTFPSG